MKIFLQILVFFPAILIAQQEPDTSLVDKNARTIEELKELIRSSVARDEKLTRLEKELSEAQTVIASLQQKIDSLESIASRVEMPKGEFLIVLQSQRKKALAELGMERLQRTWGQPLHLVQSSSGYWYYVVFDLVAPEQLDTTLSEVRKKVPDAWYISSDKISPVSPYYTKK